MSIEPRLEFLGPDDAISICEEFTADLTALYNIGSNTAIWTINGIVIAEPTAATSSGTYSLTLWKLAVPHRRTLAVATMRFRIWAEGLFRLPLAA